ncbi:MAG: type II CAAX endopeptidase family protein [Planctomycetia bacterium]|nr:type II CAAX endopeptidase family protein [Planctomycetia bacterium]
MTETKISNPKKRCSKWIILATLLFPSLITLIYFVFGEQNAILQKTAYLLGKTVQFGFPVVWTAFVLKERWRIRRFSSKGIAEGGIFGGLVFVLIVGLFYLFQFFPEFRESIDQMKTEVFVRMTRLGLGSPLPYFFLAVFYSVIHSGLEEYYWRWFAFRLVNQYCPWLIAAIIANLGFALHHVIILGCYFGFASFLTWFCVLGVFIGGLYWSILYHRSNSIYGPWLSHGLVDAAIFFVGFLIVVGL